VEKEKRGLTIIRGRRREMKMGVRIIRANERVAFPKNLNRQD